MAKKRMLFLDLLKILAILLVIFNHSHWFVRGDFGAVGNSIHYFMFALCKIAVPIFLFVTGALLLGRTVSYKEVFTKRIFRVAVPLVVVTFITCLMYGGHIKGYFMLLFTDYYFIPYDPYWLWYLYLLMALYLMTPFINKMIKNFTDKDFKMFILFFVLGLSFAGQVPIISNLILGYPLSIKGRFVTALFSIGVGYYVTGYYLNRIEITKKMFKINIVVLFHCIF